MVVSAWSGCNQEGLGLNGDDVDGGVVGPGSDASASVTDLAAPARPDLAVGAGDMSRGVSACGFTGQSCCQGACYSGACCVADRCVESGSDCGGAQLCSDGTCGAVCGAPGQTCCPGKACNGGGCCVDNACVGENSACGMFGSCFAGSCQNEIMGQPMNCGALGQACCGIPRDGIANFCTVAGSYCVPDRGTGRCAACGGPGQVCCDNNTCAGGGCCVGGQCAANGQTCGRTMCMNGSCSGGTCGSVGQMCCAAGRDQICTGPNARCLGDQCQHCGGLGDRCCLDLFGEPSVCSAPFKVVLVPDNGRNVCYCK